MKRIVLVILLFVSILMGKIVVRYYCDLCGIEMTHEGYKCKFTVVTILPDNAKKEIEGRICYKCFRKILNLENEDK